MGQVTVKVNGRDYAVGCDDGEEQHILYLAEFVDKRLRELVARLGPLAESRSLLLAALMVADDLSVAYEEVDQLRAEMSRLKEQVSRLDGTADRLNGQAARIETLAAQVEET